MLKPGTPEFLEEFARDVHVGLSSRPKYLLAKYFYDKRGSELFEAITQLPEYYPTKTEASILRAYADEIRGALDGEFSLVELGSGSSTKTTILLDNILETQKKLHYLPIDISPTILDETVRALDARYPQLTTIPIASDYGAGLKKANRIADEGSQIASRKLVLFLGSSIGNLEPEEARSFLGMIRQKLDDQDALLVGFDLQKAPDILLAAYEDRSGVTAQFNLNILHRINRELGGHFEVDTFTHEARYNESHGRVELHLVSRAPQTVVIDKLAESFSFGANESIHTENSYKYTEEQIQRYGESGGLDVRCFYTDPKRWFALALFVPI